MPSYPRATPGDGVRVVRPSATRRVLRLTLVAMSAVVLAVVAALLGLRVAPARLADPPAAPPSAASSAAPDARNPFVVPPPVVVAEPVPPARRTTPPPRAVPRPRPPAANAEPPEKEDAPFNFGDPKEKTGMRVFPPMGTKPIKRGIIVPEDFVLPPGYVRHYQSTDDGERLPAILMFSPDYEWVDEGGRPVTLPPDRVVPPELAPPGLAVELLEPPAPRTAPDPRP